MRQFTLTEITEALAGLRDQTAGATDPRLAFINFCLTHLTDSRAQFLQDLWVAWELGSPRDGYFVEFGATNGLKFSNSWYLETALGWRGILAEPARIWHPALHNNRACHIDERCVWVESGRTLMFNQTEIAAHSTIDSFSDSDMHAASRRDGERYPVQTVSLNDMLAFWNAPHRIDYLSIDTEGSELDILQHFDWTAHDVRLISVEHNFTDRRGPIYDFLSSKGYARKFEALSNVDDWYMKTDGA